ncbi:MAG: hypothetical protein IPK85_03230 [Gemmatimonadetes bacterium]|nr:hypothetical protein [Gemmatimonadota bacterium]
MLSAINYGSLWFDGEGVARATPYVSPRLRAAEFEYRTDDVSVILPDAAQSLDLYSLPNRWVLIVSNSTAAPGRRSATDPASLTSILELRADHHRGHHRLATR